MAGFSVSSEQIRCEEKEGLSLLHSHNRKVSSSGLPIWQGGGSCLSSNGCTTSPSFMVTSSPQETTYKEQTKKGSISYLSLGFIAYFAVAAGPFGVEAAVRAGGK